MSELLIGVSIGVLLVMNLVALIAIGFVIYSGGRLMDDLEDLEDSVEESLGAFDTGVRQAFVQLDGAMQQLARHQGYAWDHESGEWRKVQ